MDKRLFEGFLTAHRPLLVLRAEQITGDRGLAEDAVQTTSVYLLSNVHRYNPDKAALLTWVLGAVSRRAFDILRARKRFFALDDVQAGEATSPGVDADYENRQQGELLGEMLGLIAAEDPDHYPLAVAILHGRGLAEIAEREGVSKQAIQTRIFWAFKRWRKILLTKFTQAEIETALGR